METKAEQMKAKLKTMRDNGWSFKYLRDEATSAVCSGYDHSEDLLVVYYNDKSLLILTLGEIQTGIRD